jgi:glycine/serine hydroxymethyltransferase
MAEIGQLIARAVKDPSRAREVADQVGALVRRFPAYAEAPVGV